MRDDFCIFILSHGRPDNIKTIRALSLAGYSGKWYIVIDDEDSMEGEYKRLFGDKVLQFSKNEVAKLFDEGDNFDEKRTPVYARNACWDLAKQVGCKYFMQLDDDYTGFWIRYDSNLDYACIRVESAMDSVICAMIDFFITTQSTSVAMSQGGDHIGGSSGKEKPNLRRKAMNSFICSTDRHFLFRGKLNDDVNTYVALSREGRLFFTIMQINLDQSQTQLNKGGITEFYKAFGTYAKSFTTVCHCPSAVKVGVLGDPSSGGHYRIHHDINWNRVAPKILREEWRKDRA